MNQDYRVDPQTAFDLLAIVHSGDMTMEAAMRLLWPQDAAKIYDLARWPWGPPEGD